MRESLRESVCERERKRERERERESQKGVSRFYGCGNDYSKAMIKT